MIETIAYFAGSFYRKPELVVYMEQWQTIGNYCTSRWLRTDHEVDFQEEVDQLAYGSEGHQFALEDIDDILRAELLVFFSSANNASKGRGGRHTEFGIALGRSIPIVLIGEPECAFHATVPSALRFKDFDDFMKDVMSQAGEVEYHLGSYRRMHRHVTSYLG